MRRPPASTSPTARTSSSADDQPGGGQGLQPPRHRLFARAAARPPRSARPRSWACEIVKVFPGGSVGGPDFVKNVLGPMPWTKIMPTGGVEATEESLKAWFGAGIVACGIGSQPDHQGPAGRPGLRRHREAGARHGRAHQEDQGELRTMAGDDVLKIRPAAECRWDCAAFGEVMLRFDPGHGRVRNARHVPGLGGRRRVQRRPRHAQVLGQARHARHRAAEERPRLAGRGPHDAGRRRHRRT